MSSALNVVYLLSLALWVGSIFFLSFFTAPTLFRELPREIAGDFISKLFPQYYMLGYATLAITSITLALRGLLEKPFPWIRLGLLLGMLACTLYAGIQIQPKAHLLRTVLRTLEDTPEKDAKQAEFNRLHKTSVILNSIVLLSGFVVVGITAVKLKP
ncbi:MAG: DUF4149 domain-containing protein [bacterium]